MMDLDKLGEIVKEERKRKNMSQEQLSEDICDAMTISRLENGKSISPQKAVPVAEASGVGTAGGRQRYDNQRNSDRKSEG